MANCLSKFYKEVKDMKLRRQIREIAMQLFLIIFTLVESMYAQVGLEQLIWKEFQISSQIN
jgi:hypothetical protein